MRTLTCSRPTRSTPILLLRCAPISIFLVIASLASRFPPALSHSPIASSFTTRASWTRRRRTCGRRPSPTFPTTCCCSWSRAGIATATSSPISPGRSSESCPAGPAVYRRSAILFTRRSGLVIPTRAQPAAPAKSMHEGVGVCRDFAHLAIALCRCMNIPARYCTGYLGDIGVPIDINPMDFSAWFEVFLDGRWYTKDARHNHPRIDRIVMGRGRDAADVAMSTAFGVANLARFEVVTRSRFSIAKHLGRGRTAHRPLPPRPVARAVRARDVARMARLPLILARWVLTVRWLIPRSNAIFLLCLPARDESMTGALASSQRETKASTWHGHDLNLGGLRGGLSSHTWRRARQAWQTDWPMAAGLSIRP